MIRFIRFLSSVLIGVVASFALGLISEGIFYLGSFALVAFFVGGVIYNIIPKGLDLVLAVIAGIAAFVSMICLHSHLEEFGKSDFVHSVILFAPYCLATWLFFEIKATDANEDNEENNS